MQQGEMGARVIMLRGVGQQRLIQAIQSGMVSADVRREIEAVINDRDRLARENEALRSQQTVLEGNLRLYRQTHMDALVEVRSRDMAASRGVSRFDIGLAWFVIGAALTGSIVILIVSKLMAGVVG